jgi:hypothetical protein
MPSPNTASRSSAQAARHAWIDDLHQRRAVTLCEKLVGTRLAFHQNLKTLKCFPSAATLSAETGIPERSVFRAIDGLRQKGLISINIGGGRGRANEYLLLPPKPRNPDKASGFKPENPDEKSLIPCQANLKETPREILKDLSLGAGEREQPSADSFSPPGAAVSLTGAAPVEDQTEELELSVAEISPQPLSELDLPKKEGLPRAEQVEKLRPRTDSERDAGFEKERLAQSFAELRALWRRGHAADDTAKAIAVARAAYAKAIAEGAQPDEIFDGAKQWIAAADASRFLPPLPSWLETHSWQKPPLEKKRTSEPARGNRGHRRDYRNGGKPDMARMMLALAGEA